MSAMPVVLVTGGYDHKIRFWEATSGVCAKTINFGDSQVNCLQISADKSLLAAGGNPLINLFDINSSSMSGDDKPVLTYDRHTSNVTSVGFQKDRKWLYSGSEDGTIRVWDPRSNVCTRTYDMSVPVNTVALSPNERELVGGDQSGNIKIWDMVADRCREELQPIVDVPIKSISIAFDESLVAVASQKGKLLVYSPSKTNGKQLELAHELQAHDDYLLKCVVSPDVNTIATTSADNVSICWPYLPRCYIFPESLEHSLMPSLSLSFLSSCCLFRMRTDDQAVEYCDLGAGAHVGPAPALGLGCRFFGRLAISSERKLRPKRQAVGPAHRRGGTPVLGTQPGHHVCRVE
jgi:target of rapamycin complex subunit LST8